MTTTGCGMATVVGDGVPTIEVLDSDLSKRNSLDTLLLRLLLVEDASLLEQHLFRLLLDSYDSDVFRK